MLIDLHTHTWPLSDDSFLSPDDLIERAKAARLDGLCLTEHDFMWEPQKVHDLARRHDFLVLPGIEVNTEDGHMLAYGLDRYVYGMHRPRELARMADEAGAALVASHPFRRNMPFDPDDEELWEMALQRAQANPAYAHVCAMEAVNGRGSRDENLFSWQLCARLGLPATAGSDAHEAADVGSCATRFDRPIRELSDLIRELKTGRFHAVSLRARAESKELT
jgi:predicted metal-dependent phosphoesterase TrpH